MTFIFFQATSAYNIVFEGVRGTSYRGDIGLDDITVTDGPCGGTDCIIRLFILNA